MNKKIVIVTSVLLALGGISAVQATSEYALYKGVKSSLNEAIDGTSLDTSVAQPSAVSRYQRARMKFLGSARVAPAPVTKSQETIPALEAPEASDEKAPANKKISKQKRKNRKKGRKKARSPKKGQRAPDSVIGRPRARMLQLHSQ